MEIEGCIINFIRECPNVLKPPYTRIGWAGSLEHGSESTLIISHCNLKKQNGYVQLA